MHNELNNILNGINNQFGINSTTPGYVCVVHNDQDIVFSHSEGLGDDQGAQLSPDSTFRIASITKQFTAVAILQLIDAGKLTVDAKISNILSDLPDYCLDITIHHLLTHTSGLHDYDSATNLDSLKRFVDQDVVITLRQFNNLEFIPGSSYHYSNAGYCLLALVIAEISGMSYKEYLKNNIFDKTNMHNAQVGTDPDITNRVFGYSWDNSTWVRHDQDTFTHTEGDGGIYASALNLTKWQNALYKNISLTSESSLGSMTTPHTPTNYDSESYGYGIAITSINDTPCYLHHGVSSGFENALFYLPKYQISVALLSNMKHPEFNTITLGKKIISNYLRYQRSS